MDGGTGDDDVIVGAGDTASGGGGDDVFTIDPTLSGSQTITITGGETDEESAIDATNNPDGKTGDVLDISGLNNKVVVYDETDPTYDPATGKSESGFVTYTNAAGDVVTINFSEIERVVCFTKGTKIRTVWGDVPIETLRVGDLVWTKDNGYQPLRWIGSRFVPRVTLRENKSLRPVRVKAGSFGYGIPEVDTYVSQQHRFVVSSRISQRLTGNDEVLVAARFLVQLDGIDFDTRCDDVVYYHLMFDQHHIVQANGSLAESLYTGPEALKSIPSEAVSEIYQLFPELADINYAPTPARPILSGRQARKLANRQRENKKPLIEA